jgi:hypothetical protein
VRPVRLGVALTELRGAHRTAQALALIARLFPDELEDCGPRDSWLDLLWRLLKRCDAAGWFEPDWKLLDDLYDWHMQSGGDDSDEADTENEQMYLMAQYLEYIPVRRYGFDDETWLNAVPEDFPLFYAVRSRVDGCFDFGEWPALDDWDVDRLVGDPAWALMEAPFGGVPALVQFCRQKTGHSLLDTGVSILQLWENGRPGFESYTWADDLERVKELADEARPIWATIEALEKWATHRSNGVEYVLELIDEVLGNDNDDTDDDHVPGDEWGDPADADDAD